MEQGHCLLSPFKLRDFFSTFVLVSQSMAQEDTSREGWSFETRIGLDAGLSCPILLLTPDIFEQAGTPTNNYTDLVIGLPVEVALVWPSMRA